MSQKDYRAKLSACDDVALCHEVSKGNDLAFEEITGRYKGLIHSIAKEYSYPGFDQSDFLQLGLMGLFHACKVFDKNSGISFKNFAALCIRRRYISLMRSLSSQKAIPQDAVVSFEGAELSIISEHSPESLIVDKESDADFLSVVKSRLSHMEYLVMKGYVNGMSYKDIAENLGLDSKAVDNALQRVRKKLLT